LKSLHGFLHKSCQLRPEPVQPAVMYSAEFNFPHSHRNSLAAFVAAQRSTVSHLAIPQMNCARP
jgi:hypothetical protein